MESVCAPIDGSPFAFAHIAWHHRTFCLFLRDTLMLMMQAGSVHASVTLKCRLRRCRLFKSSPSNPLPPADCLRVRGCLHVLLYLCSICAPENAHGRGSRRGLPFYTAPKSCDVQIAVPELSTHVATLLYIATTNIVPWWGRLCSADIPSGGVPAGLQSGIIILYQHGGGRLYAINTKRPP